MSDESQEQELKHGMHEHSSAKKTPTQPLTRGTEQQQIDANSSKFFENASNIQFLIQTIAHNTQRIENLVTDFELIKARIILLEQKPIKQLDIIKSITPIIAILFTLILGSLALEVTTLFFVLQHFGI